MDGLAHLANGAALERETGDVDHALVSVVEGSKPVPAVERQTTLTRSEDRDPPVALVRELLESRQQALDRVRVSDRIPGNDRDAGHDLVGEERPSVCAKEVRLVRAQHKG